MRLVSMSVRNFRSIRALDCAIGEMSIFLGPNNHGKSNLLAAIEFLLSSGMRLSKDDFFTGRPPEDNRLTVEAEFRFLTPDEQTTFKKYLRSDGSIRIQKFAVLGDGGNVETGYRGYLEQPSVWWLQDGAYERLKTKDAVTAEAREVPALNALLEGGGKITKDRVAEFQATYIDANRGSLDFETSLETSNLLGQKNVAAGVLPDFYLIPAVRDLGDETKTIGTSTFNRLLQRAVTEMTARDPAFLDLQAKMGDLLQRLNERPEDPGKEPSSELGRLENTIKTELTPWGVGVNIRVTPPEMKKVFELGTELWLDDGHETLAERKGHGLQRAVIFALIRAWSSALRNTPADGSAKARTASESLIFAYEEPELFLHPHAQRTLADSLKTIAGTPEHQVLLCTHSTHFVDVENYRSIGIVHRPDPKTGTQIRQCTRDLFEGDGLQDRKNRFHMASWINPDRGELFFAKKIVLVEGETEKTILPYLASRLGCRDRQVSVIDCGSKHNLPLYVEILNAFGIRYSVVHDEDPVPDPPPQEWDADKLRSKKETFALNARIEELVDPAIGRREMLSRDFEEWSGVSRTQGAKKGKPLAALDHFSVLEADGIPDDVAIVVRRVFDTA